MNSTNSYAILNNYYTESKVPKSRIIILILITIFSFLLFFVINNYVCVVSQKGFTFHSLFEKNIVFYSYSDIEKIELFSFSMPSSFISKYKPSIAYDITFTDGNQIVLHTLESIYSSEESIISFDKKVSNMRCVVGEFIKVNSKEVLNDYFSALFNEC